MKREIRIGSYFSIDTDLAAEMADWAEFVSGEGYSVKLRDTHTGEEVSVAFVERENDFSYVTVRSSSAGQLFDRVLGRAISALSQHSDNLWVDRHGDIDT